MFNGITGKDWLIGLFTGGWWIFYKIYKNGSSGKALKVIGIGLIIFIMIGVITVVLETDEDKFNRALKSNDTVKMENIVAKNSDLIIDGKKATEILDNLHKREAERLAKEEAEKVAKEKAKAERIAKEKAEAEKIAKEKAEAEKIAKEKAEPFKMEFTTTTKFKQHLSIKSDDAAWMVKNKREMNAKAKPLISYNDFFLDYKNGKLFIASKYYTKDEIYYNNEMEVDIDNIKDIVIYTNHTNGEVSSIMKYLSNLYTLQLRVYAKNDFSTNNKLIMPINFNDLENLNKLKKHLTSKISLKENKKVAIHNEKDFTQRVHITERPIMCESKRYLASALVLAYSSQERFDEALKNGNCISASAKIENTYIEKNIKLEDEVLVKATIDGNEKYLWASKKEVKLKK